MGKHQRQGHEGEIVLNRLCFLDDVQVLGGASKLFHKCIIWAKKERYKAITTFSDNRWSVGNIYEVLKFKLKKILPPDYSYVDTNTTLKRVSKHSQKKSNTGCPEHITEFEWSKKKGLIPLWDLGKKTWIYDLGD